MTFDRLIAQPKHLLLKCISGSRAFNLNIASSDTDIKGIFILPLNELYGFTFTEQVSNKTNDEVYFEIGKFMELMCKNNPNILELLSTPQNSILFKNPLLDLIKPGDFLSKLCLDTFAGYAKTQIKKARGLNKKNNKPHAENKKLVTDYCHVVINNKSIPLHQWLLDNNYYQEDCGLVKLAHLRDTIPENNP
ncbi:MAG: nucleotidyltransferase domain-containing protein [Chitinophagaceae bacterium]